MMLQVAPLTCARFSLVRVNGAADVCSQGRTLLSTSILYSANMLETQPAGEIASALTLG